MAAARAAVRIRYQGYSTKNRSNLPTMGSRIWRAVGPHCQIAYFWSTRETPKVARMVVSGSRPTSGRSVLICSAAPKTAMTTAAARSASQKLPVKAIVAAPVNPPSMTRSPWAKFTTSMIPKMSVRPEATRARIIPFTRPVTVWTRMASTR